MSSAHCAMDLEAICQGPITASQIDLLVQTAKTTIPIALPTQSTPTIPPLKTFLHTLTHKLKIRPSTLLTSLVYLTRLKSRLPPTARGIPCTLHRLSLAALLVATKFLHDGAIRNRLWAVHSGEFSLAEVNLMERQLLVLLGFDVHVSMQDIRGVMELGGCVAEAAEPEPEPVLSTLVAEVKAKQTDISMHVIERISIPIPIPITTTTTQQQQQQQQHDPSTSSTRDPEYRTVFLRRPSGCCTTVLEKQPKSEPKTKTNEARGCIKMGNATVVGKGNNTCATGVFAQTVF